MPDMYCPARTNAGNIPPMKLDPVTLKLFVRVLEEGTISRAAECEHIAAAAVSRRIAELEDSLQTLLLSRSNKGVTPTPAGLELLYHAKALLNSINTIETRLKAYVEGQNELVHILANPTAIIQFLPQPLGLFSRENPNIRVQLEEHTSVNIVQKIESGKADLGVFTDLPYEAQIDTYPFRQDKLILLVPKNHPLAGQQSIVFEQTLGYEHISLLAGTQINYQITKAAMETGIPLHLRTVVSGYDTMCLLINAGMGIGILPLESVAAYHVPDTVIVELENDWRHRNIVIGVRNRKELHPAANVLLNFLLSTGSTATSTTS